VTAELARSSDAGIEGNATETQNRGAARLGTVSALSGISQGTRQLGFEASDEGMTGGGRDR
jgi:hypothetical protein